MSALYERDGRSPEPGQPSWIPYKPDQAQVTIYLSYYLYTVTYNSHLDEHSGPKCIPYSSLIDGTVQWLACWSGNLRVAGSKPAKCKNQL